MKRLFPRFRIRLSKKKHWILEERVRLIFWKPLLVGMTEAEAKEYIQLVQKA